MSNLVPTKVPQRSQLDVKSFLRDNFPKLDLSRPVMFGVRGYYRDSMGLKLKNDRRIYDDAVFLLSPTLFAAFNFNTDPNGYREGRGTGSGKGMATLKKGVWSYKIGLHRGYPAFRQDAPVTVVRDGRPPYEDTGDFAINIHMGGQTGTSSLGCQTVPREQWPQFKSTFYAELKRYNTSQFKYVLVDESDTHWNG